METKGKQKAKRPPDSSDSSESSAEDPYSGSEEDEVEKTLKITQEHERNYQLSQMHASTKATLLQFDPNLLFFLLGSPSIRDNLLFYVTDRDLESLSRTCNAMKHIVTRAYLQGLHRFASEESFEKFAIGCWETLDGEVAFADRTSVVYHLMNEMANRKFCFFYGHNFVALPRVYLEDLIKVAWVSLILASRSRYPHKCSSYALVSTALINSRMCLREDNPFYYIMGDRYVFSHEHATPFRFDTDIPARSSALFYLKSEKTEIALYALLGRIVNNIDERTNSRLRTYIDAAEVIKKRFVDKTTKLHLFPIQRQQDLYDYYGEWKFAIKTHNPIPTHTVVLPSIENGEKGEPNGCIIS